MKFISLRDFRSRTAEIRRDLDTQHEIVLTANGKPIAILAQVDEESFEDRLKSLRRARTAAVFDRIQAKAKARGIDKMTMADIDNVIAKARRDKRSGR